MRSIHYPVESFRNKNDIKNLNEILVKYSDTLFHAIDDKVEIWVFGNKDRQFINILTQLAIQQRRVIDPSNQLPILDDENLQFIALINHESLEDSTVYNESIYGTVNCNLNDFISLLIYRLTMKYPKYDS